MRGKTLRLIVVITFICLFLYANNHWLQISRHEIVSERIPESFDGLVIVQLSDIHDAEFGENQSKLAEKVKKISPDLIFLTGDIVDSNRYDLEKSLNLVEQLAGISDVYFVTGNHEIAANRVDEITDALRSLGVHVLTNETRILEQNGEIIGIGGIEDPLMKPAASSEATVDESVLRTFNRVPANTYRILLSHRPEMFDVYARQKVDLVFSGHAHGGQVRIPGVGGLFAPGQGWFPRYTAGLHKKGMTTMMVSRGLGNSIVSYKIFNRPEIVVVTLKKERH